MSANRIFPARIVAAALLIAASFSYLQPTQAASVAVPVSAFGVMAPAQQAGPVTADLDVQGTEVQFTQAETGARISISYGNRGQGVATGVVLTASVPSGAVYDPARSDSG
jgi:hypothetical protein